MVAKGKYGYFIKYNGKNYKIKPEFDGETLSKKDAIKCVEDVGEKSSKVIKKLGKNGEYAISIGQYGPYVRLGKVCSNIPSSISPHNITLSKAKELIRKKKMYMAVGLKSVRKKKGK